MKKEYKNIALLLTYVISIIPKFFYESNNKIWLSLLHVRDDKTYIGMTLLYYSIAINFFILSYCLHYSKGLDKRITRLILVITTLDFFHLILLAKQGFGIPKILLAILIVLGYDFYNKRYGSS